MKNNQNWKIDQIIGKRERIAIKKENVFVWDNVWAVDDVRVRNRTSWYCQSACSCSFIPPSTAEVESTVSLMKLICTLTRKRLNQESLGGCVSICKYKELCECDFQEIMDLWLEAEDATLISHSVCLGTDSPQQTTWFSHAQKNWKSLPS